MSHNTHSFLAINMGNSRTQIGRFEAAELKQIEHFSNEELPGIVDKLGAWRDEMQLMDGESGAILLASVNEPVAEGLVAAIEDTFSTEVLRIGSDIPIPIGQQLDPETIIGVDRLLNAAAAFDRVKQACVVVDAGTAITIDFVDGEGTFHGGAIAPGASMQLHSLHERTAALPDLPFRAPDPEPFGRNTAQAMYQGVFHGIRGMVQRLVEQYAQHYGGFPLVIATGGDAAVLFEKEELIDRIVPELTLLGIALTAKHIAANYGDDSDDE